MPSLGRKHFLEKNGESYVHKPMIKLFKEKYEENYKLDEVVNPKNLPYIPPRLRYRPKKLVLNTETLNKGGKSFADTLKAKRSSY